MTSNKATRSRMQELGDYVTSARFSSLPAEVVWRAKMITLDNIGCAMLGSTLPGSPAILQSVDVLGSGNDATIALKSPRAASVFSAAIVMKDGSRLTELCEHPRGLQATPPTEADYLGKFRHLAGHFVPAQRVERIIDLVLHLDTLKDVAELGTAMSA